MHVTPGQITSRNLPFVWQSFGGLPVSVVTLFSREQMFGHSSLDFVALNGLMMRIVSLYTGGTLLIPLLGFRCSRVLKTAKAMPTSYPCVHGEAGSASM